MSATMISSSLDPSFGHRGSERWLSACPWARASIPGERLVAMRGHVMYFEGTVLDLSCGGRDIAFFTPLTEASHHGITAT